MPLRVLSSESRAASRLLLPQPTSPTSIIRAPGLADRLMLLSTGCAAVSQANVPSCKRNVSQLTAGQHDERARPRRQSDVAQHRLRCGLPGKRAILQSRSSFAGAQLQ